MAFKPILAPHLFKLESLIQQAKLLGGRHQILAEVSDGQQSWPVHALEMGSSDPGAPAIGFIGGVHGLERIGAEVVMEHLGALVNQLPDSTARAGRGPATFCAHRQSGGSE